MRFIQSYDIVNCTGESRFNLVNFAIKMAQLQTVFFNILLEMYELILIDATILLLLWQQGGVSHLLVSKLRSNHITFHSDLVQGLRLRQKLQQRLSDLRLDMHKLADLSQARIQVVLDVPFDAYLSLELLQLVEMMHMLWVLVDGRDAHVPAILLFP